MHTRMLESDLDDLNSPLSEQFASIHAYMVKYIRYEVTSFIPIFNWRNSNILARCQLVQIIKVSLKSLLTSIVRRWVEHPNISAHNFASVHIHVHVHVLVWGC